MRAQKHCMNTHTNCNWIILLCWRFYLHIVRACKGCSLVLSRTKKVHPLVLSVFFFRFCFFSASRMKDPD